MDKYGHIRTINLEYQLPHGMKNTNYVIDDIQYHIFEFILSIS